MTNKIIDLFCIFKDQNQVKVDDVFYIKLPDGSKLLCSRSGNELVLGNVYILFDNRQKKSHL